jgi:hypothetical protein
MIDVLLKYIEFVIYRLEEELAGKLSSGLFRRQDQDEHDDERKIYQM